MLLDYRIWTQSFYNLTWDFDSSMSMIIRLTLLRIAIHRLRSPSFEHSFWQVVKFLPPYQWPTHGPSILFVSVGVLQSYWSILGSFNPIGQLFDSLSLLRLVFQWPKLSILNLTLYPWPFTFDRWPATNRHTHKRIFFIWPSLQSRE